MGSGVEMGIPFLFGIDTNFGNVIRMFALIVEFRNNEMLWQNLDQIKIIKKNQGENLIKKFPLKFRHSYRKIIVI